MSKKRFMIKGTFEGRGFDVSALGMKRIFSVIYNRKRIPRHMQK